MDLTVPNSQQTTCTPPEPSPGLLHAAPPPRDVSPMMCMQEMPAVHNMQPAMASSTTGPDTPAASPTTTTSTDAAGYKVFKREIL